MGGGNTQSSEQNDKQEEQKAKDAAKGFTKTCFYEVLGVDRDAGEADLKKAFRKLSLKLHPDKNKDRDTTDEFQTLNEAYQCLSDP